jgi:hypothetical protein
LTVRTYVEPSKPQRIMSDMIADPSHAPFRRASPA